jgi:hypothetical protein
VPRPLHPVGTGSQLLPPVAEYRSLRNARSAADTAARAWLASAGSHATTTAVTAAAAKPRRLLLGEGPAVHHRCDTDARGPM